MKYTIDVLRIKPVRPHRQGGWAREEKMRFTYKVGEEIVFDGWHIINWKNLYRPTVIIKVRGDGYTSRYIGIIFRRKKVQFFKIFSDNVRPAVWVKWGL